MQENNEDVFLKEQLNHYSIDMNETERYLLLEHLHLVIEKNKSINLTRIDGIEDGIAFHIIDSLTCLPEFNNAPQGPFCDMGTGAGYPGIPLGVVSGRNGTLVDSVKKKALCVEEFVNELGVSNQFEIEGVRAEELAIKRKGFYAVVVARALSSLPSLVELASPLLMRGGVLISLKGKPEDRELYEGDLVADKTGMERLSRRDFYMGNEDVSRCIITYKKVGSPKVKLPRRSGMAQRNPLV